MNNHLLIRSTPRIAVCIPCFNEALCIATVLDELSSVLPEAQLHVFDNNSTDGTAEVAIEHGATVSRVTHRGKGNVVRRMFADIQADVYIMVDGDATYDMAAIRNHVSLLWDNTLDMVVGKRVDDGANAGVYRRGHRVGNRLLTGTVTWLFGRGQFTDILSGYRLFSQRYVKSFPAATRGFEIETELTVHALELRMPCAEVLVKYSARPEGSDSKLSTYRDGLRILKTAGVLVVSERPLAFFLGLSIVLGLASILMAMPLASEYLRTGLVPRFPTAVLATGVMLAAMLSAVCGAVLNTVTTGRQELKRLFYLSHPAPGTR